MRLKFCFYFLATILLGLFCTLIYPHQALASSPSCASQPTIQNDHIITNIIPDSNTNLILNQPYKVTLTYDKVALNPLDGATQLQVNVIDYNDPSSHPKIVYTALTIPISQLISNSTNSTSVLLDSSKLDPSHVFSISVDYDHQNQVIDCPGENFKILAPTPTPIPILVAHSACSLAFNSQGGFAPTHVSGVFQTGPSDISETNSTYYQYFLVAFPSGNGSTYTALTQNPSSLSVSFKHTSYARTTDPNPQWSVNTSAGVVTQASTSTFYTTSSTDYILPSFQSLTLGSYVGVGIGVLFNTVQSNGTTSFFTEAICPGSVRPFSIVTNPDPTFTPAPTGGPTSTPFPTAGAPTSTPAPASVNTGFTYCNIVTGKEIDPSTVGDQGSNAGILTAIGCVPTDPSEFIKGLLKFIMGIGGGIALLLMFSAVFKMITSQGDEQALHDAQSQLTSTIIGLLFIIFSVLLLQIIGVDILNIPGFK